MLMFSQTAPLPEATVLDAYIIDRIRRERERVQRDGRIPLHIEPPRVPPERDEGRPTSDPSEIPGRPERGTVVIDFRL